MTFENCTQTCSTFSEIFEQEAPFVYTTYLYTGAFSFILTLTLFLYQICKKPIYPYTILTHLSGILTLQSFLFLSNALSYFFKYFFIEITRKRGRIEETGVHCYSFGLTFSCCPVESIIHAFTILCFFAWNFTWIFDLIREFKIQSHDTRKFSLVYPIVVYIVAALSSDIFFELRHAVFSMVFFYFAI